MAKTQVRRENAANPKDRRARAKAEKLRLERFENAVREVLASPAGQIVLADKEHGIIARCHTFASTFATDSNTMAYLAGRQSLGHELIRLFEGIDEQLYLEMDARSRARRKSDDVQLAGELARVADQPTDDEE